MRPLTIATLLAAVALTVVASCSKSSSYDTKVTLQHMQAAQTDATGIPRVLEVEVEYPDCPGEQLETLQGNAEFAQCMSKYRIGDVVPATIRHEAMPDGHYDSEIEKLGDCARHREPRDRRSYEVVQVCEDIVINGVTAGFHCDRKPSTELLAKCPWFARK